MTVLVGVLAVILFGAPPGQTGPPRPWRHAVDHGTGDSTRTLVVDGRTRTYLAHVPPDYDGHTPLPVVLVFHGGLSNAPMTIRFTGLSEKADQARFLAVYPSGTGRLSRALTWNAGSCCGYAQHERVDDVAFVRALLDDLAAHFAVDARRIYATGISNGGMMVHRLGAELADRIAAVASVSGPLSIETIHPSRPVSVMHFHGTADEFAPFAGGTGEKSLASIQFRSAPDSVAAWVRADGCPGKPEAAALPVKAGDPTRVRRETYGPCKAGSEVVFYVIDGGGHAWPGREARVQFLGTSTQSISANDLMWDFFQKHARP
jgi:polyhydroxybutyrate depolymerase